MKPSCVVCDAEFDDLSAQRPVTMPLEKDSPLLHPEREGKGDWVYICKKCWAKHPSCIQVWAALRKKNGESLEGLIGWQGDDAYYPPSPVLRIP